MPTSRESKRLRRKCQQGSALPGDLAERRAIGFEVAAREAQGHLGRGDRIFASLLACQDVRQVVPRRRPVGTDVDGPAEGVLRAGIVAEPVSGIAEAEEA